MMSSMLLMMLLMQANCMPNDRCSPDSDVAGRHIPYRSTEAASLHKWYLRVCNPFQSDLQLTQSCAAQLFAVAIRRASKCAAWATVYAQLCAQLWAAVEPSGQHRAVESAVQGRATAEYCKLSVRTVSVMPQGTPKSTDQVRLRI